MAIGVAFGSIVYNIEGATIAAAISIAIGIAIQNFPEGAAISIPIRRLGVKRTTSFLIGASTGIVEPIAAFLTILLANLVTPILPYLLSFAAGAMIYVVVEELIPESQSGEHSNLATIGVAIGFTLMMILDIALG
jgi:ZIP family zinc transporter